jgi:hypothetical protein
MSYYQFYPGEVYSGVGACGCGCGSLGVIGAGGGTSFSASKAWAGWKACSGGSQSQCLEAVDSIRAALGELGYGQLPFGQPWSGADQAAIKAVAGELGLPVSAIPTEAVLAGMEELLRKGQKPGPEPAVKAEKIGGRYMTVPGGLGTVGLVAAGVLALAAVGGLAIMSKRKGKKPVTVTA